MNTPLNSSDASLGKSDFVIAKIVSTPSETSWSQAYNAGNLFAVLSLKKEVQGEEIESESLGAIGKKILDSLEQNFFTIENKNLGSIKQAVTESSKTIPDDIESSLVVCAFVKNILYLFVNDKGKVFLKRGNNYGTILESNEIDSKSIVSSSGYVQNNDLIILGTKTFFDIVSSQTLVSSLNHKSPAEIAEILTPNIHEKEEGKAAAIIIQYEEKKKMEVSLVEEKQEEINPSTSFGKAQDKSSGQKYTFFENLLSSLKKRVKILKPQFNHSKRVFLTIAIVILIIFISSVFFAIKKQTDTKTKALFEEIYTKAQKSYDEGASLLDLNKNLARDSFSTSQKILNDGKTKFPQNSKEEKQILTLLQKVNNGLSSSSAISLVKATVVDVKNSKLLNAELTNSKSAFFTQDDKNIYFAGDNNVYSISKSDSKTATIIKNDNFWQKIGGLGVYLGNIYVLDQKSILKFVQTSNGFAKSNYLSNNITPDFSKAQSIAIDGAIYVLLSDGTIEKFLRGNLENFTVSGLDKPFLNPSRITTDLNFKNLYILDNGNGRIVVLDKNGVYISQYQSDILKGAKDFEALESQKKIFVLSLEKIYQINLQM